MDANADRLASLGNEIGLLQEEEKKECGDVLRQYVEWIEEQDRTQLIEQSLKSIMEDTYTHPPFWNDDHPISDCLTA